MPGWNGVCGGRSRYRNQVLTFLGLMRIIVDPTTAGIGDSERARGYTESCGDSVNK